MGDGAVVVVDAPHVVRARAPERGLGAAGSHGVPRGAVPVDGRAGRVAEVVGAAGPDVVGPRSPDRGQELGAAAADGAPGAAVPVQDRAVVTDGPEVVGSAAPDAGQVRLAVAVDLGPDA